MQKIRVFLLDDHAIVRHGLRTLLEAEDDITVVGEAGSVAEGREGVVAHRPDVALVDVRLPDGSGVDVVRAVRERAPEVRMLMLSSYDDEETLVQAFSAGVTGYVLKQIDPEALLTSLRTVAAGTSLVDPAIARWMMHRMRQHHAVPRPCGFDDLTPQEVRILGMIGEGLTNREIGERLFLSEKTIKNKVTSLMAKLGVQRRTQAAVLAARMRA